MALKTRPLKLDISMSLLRQPLGKKRLEIVHKSIRFASDFSPCTASHIENLFCCHKKRKLLTINKGCHVTDVTHAATEMNVMIVAKGRDASIFSLFSPSPLSNMSSPLSNKPPSLGEGIYFQKKSRHIDLSLHIEFLLWPPYWI